MAREPVCFACGCATGPLPRLNRLPNGEVCPACRDRLLDRLPPALPAGRWEPADDEEWVEERHEAGDDFRPGA